MGEESDGSGSAQRRPVYVEIGIRAPIERVWVLSQDPALHTRWDLRFSRISPTSSDDQGLVRFRYEFRLPFHTIHGLGTSLGHRHRSDGQATSVLKFDTADVLSPIGQGSGYWRYIPAEDGLRFITGYNYRPGMGAIGRVLDARVFRPALGWATAISFDRLRLWAESDLDPGDARNRWFADAAARAVGILAAGFLLRRALKGRDTGTAALGVSVALAACMLPAHPSVPRAGRCLRHAPDPRAAHAPSALASLPSPAAPGVGGQPGGRGYRGLNL
ncbi:MAG TPA: hypothetical protein VJ617_05640 [Arthrobacter sp.]|nr:hypothetical protein [Arthrobacter sp.]